MTTSRGWFAGVVMAFGLSIPSVASAQQDDAPPEVVLLRSYGSNGTLTFDGMRRYLIATAFVPLDGNEDGVLDVEEYTLARLYLRPESCQDLPGASAQFDKEKAAARRALDATALFDVNDGWRRHIEQMAEAHWKRTEPDRLGTGTEPGPGLDLEGIAAYLARETRKPVLPTAKASEAGLEALSGGTLPDPVPELKVREFYRNRAFAALDLDGSGRLDLREFTTAFPAFEQSAEFCDLAGADFLIDRAEFDTRRSPHFHRYLLALVPPLFAGDVSLAALRTQFREEEEAAKAAARLDAVTPHGFVEGYGFLVHGTRTVKEKAITYDADKPAVFVRVIKDFTFDDPTTAEPAAFTVTKEKGTPATIGVDAAVQVDYDPASKVVRRVSFGVDVERNTATDPQVHRQRYYAAANLFLFHAGSPLESHGIRLAPYLENDDRKDVQRLAGDVIWTPGLHLGSFLTNTWMPLGRHADWYFAPRAAVEFARVVSRQPAVPEPDGSHARLELLWGFMAGRFNTTFKTIRRRGFDDALGYSHFEELSAWWDFDDLRRFSIKTTASWGKTSPLDAANKSAVTTGLGIRF